MHQQSSTACLLRFGVVVLLSALVKTTLLSASKMHSCASSILQTPSNREKITSIAAITKNVRNVHPWTPFPFLMMDSSSSPPQDPDLASFKFTSGGFPSSPSPNSHHAAIPSPYTNPKTPASQLRSSGPRQRQRKTSSASPRGLNPVHHFSSNPLMATALSSLPPQTPTTAQLAKSALASKPLLSRHQVVTSP